MNSTLRQVVENCGKSAKDDAFRVFFAVLSRGGSVAKCTIFCKYNSHITLIFAVVRNSCFRKSWRCAPWCATSTTGCRWSFGRSASAAPREMTWRPNWILRTACHDFSAGERCTVSWAQNSSGNPHARIYTPEWPAFSHLYPRMTCLLAAVDGRDIYQDIVPSLSSVPCQQLHKSDNRQTSCCPYLLNRSSTKK